MRLYGQRLGNIQMHFMFFFVLFVYLELERKKGMKS